MKTNRILFVLPLLCLFTLPAQGQILKKLGKRAEKAAERTVERRVEKETAEKTDQVLDSILEPGSKGNQGYPQNPPSGGENDPGNTGNPNDRNTPGMQGEAGGPKTIQVYSKFDFVPGDKLLFFDDFALDFIGDFPSKWNTNGSGEVVTIGDSRQKWFEILSGHGTYYIPDVPSLPEEYTIEFDLLALGVDRKTSSTATLEVGVSDNNTFNQGSNYARALIPFCQYTPIGVRVKNYNRSGAGAEINNVVKADLRQVVLNQPHVSIAVNKQRFRLWINERKYVDIPRMIPEGIAMNAVKFKLTSFRDGIDRLFISNVKVAEGGLDLRRQLIAEGEVSTNGILFDSGSANIQPQSMGIIRQISQVLQQEVMMNLMIEGHTDSDGDDASNMDLSKRRADAVRNALVDIYNVADSRLQTGGKGESEPVGDNGTSDGKAQNRRVVFKRI